jgi:hypothetical protein
MVCYQAIPVQQTILLLEAESTDFAPAIRLGFLCCNQRAVSFAKSHLGSISFSFEGFLPLDHLLHSFFVQIAGLGGFLLFGKQSLDPFGNLAKMLTVDCYEAGSLSGVPANRICE